MAKTPVGVVRQALAEYVDAVGRRKDGTIIVRRGYFYRGGLTADKFAECVTKRLVANGINAQCVDSGDVWKPFRGGDSIAQGSHFYAVFRVLT